MPSQARVLLGERARPHPVGVPEGRCRAIADANRGGRREEGEVVVIAYVTFVPKARDDLFDQQFSWPAWLLNARAATAVPGQQMIPLEYSPLTVSTWTRNLHHDSVYPLVPGHEIAGVVTEVGSDVMDFKLGDHVAVGTYINSCRDCDNCNSLLENHCSNFVFTFNGVDTDGTVTKGGYSSHIVVHERYCYKIPDGYPLEKAAPLACAGITVYTPMIRHNMNQPGKSLGVIGLGGLGHMAVKFGKAFGLNVTILSTSESKRDEAINLLGADNFVVSSDKNQMESLKNSLDFIVDTASGDHPFDPYLALLKVRGVMALVGFPGEIRVHPASLNLGARTLSGSVVGGTKDTQEMINFCAVNKIYPNVEVIKIDYINEALERLVNRDVKYRFVIDIESSFK
ncbi:putative cinnamyl alcohol dehydrogenase 1 [Triticum urartu]|uniref:cinnamyl-alcohol dehydrogenase n=1 Tax=Triticum urartu TaxID=4572 RepID=M7Z5N9_TRIUA|nr:putative cinnamyl alcohol dehydrogenase 1 [Triticum urartu]